MILSDDVYFLDVHCDLGSDSIYTLLLYMWHYLSLASKDIDIA